ncbi:MAG: hypoxanthine phosphoribosyltransferase [Syntrophorhabdaceae bacterium]|nr:hypoxanthine phosphoribosyltransferase [Syntrophorhabdaceae bacterium]MDD4195042.1 hypoxanthine phosphoribosyltransferase [Syntrophorhabdaceae bacterium]HOC46332.1 hypoxanthine phosphoribosyltransferase [Syntrophorhabdaceae bacterium]
MLKKLFSEQDIARTVKRLAKQIENDFMNEELLFVCLLKGSFIFTSDLIRQVKNPSRIDFMRVSSYGNQMTTRGNVEIIKDLDEDIEAKNVIIVEDIIDSGLTLTRVREMLRTRNPKRLKICALIDKRRRRRVDIEADYVGFTIDDGFVVGYGIDYAEYHRNCPDICIVMEENGV